MTKHQARALSIERLYSYVGYSVISIAGLYLAAVAHQVERYDAWVVAYAVLIVGIAQIAIGKGIAAFHDRPLARPAWALFALFNIANILVMLGRGMTASPLVIAGSIGVVVAMLFAIWLVRGHQRSWPLVGYYTVVISVLLGSIAGAILTLL